MNESVLNMTCNKFKFYHYPILSSTMDRAAELLPSHRQAKSFEPYVVMVDEQTKGRGRLNRTWISPVGNFLATYVLCNHHKQIPTGLYAIVSAIAVADCFNRLGIKVQLKWPNDIFLEGKKLGGILIEIVDGQFILIGIGINLAKHPQHHILKPAISLSQVSNKKLSPYELHQNLQDDLSTHFNNLMQDKMDTIIERWQNYCLHHQQMVSVRHSILNNEDNMTYGGLYQGLDSSGALILKDIQTGKHQLVYVGDVI